MAHLVEKSAVDRGEMSNAVRQIFGDSLKVAGRSRGSAQWHFEYRTTTP